MLVLTSCYCKFIPVYVDFVRHLTQLTHKTVPFILTEQCQRVFELLKEALMTNPILVYPDPNKPSTSFTNHQSMPGLQC